MWCMRLFVSLSSSLSLFARFLRRLFCVCVLFCFASLSSSSLFHSVSVNPFRNFVNLVPPNENKKKYMHTHPTHRTHATHTHAHFNSAFVLFLTTGEKKTSLSYSYNTPNTHTHTHHQIYKKKIGALPFLRRGHPRIRRN